MSKHIFKINTDLITQSLLWIYSTRSIFYKPQNENNGHVLILDPSWDSIASIATRYGLDGLGFETMLGVRFTGPIQTGDEAHSAFCKWVLGLFPRGEAAGAWH